jgi:hypothetical protein
MTGYKPAFFVTAALLAASLGWHWWSRSEVAPAPTTPMATAPSATASVEAEVHRAAEKLNAAQREVLRLRAELDRCRDQSWDMAADIMRGQSQAFASGGGGGDSICAISQTLLRKQWAAGEAKARETLGRELGTDAWVKNDLAWRMRRHREHFDLAARDEAALESGYRGIWHRHGERMREQAAKGDWEGVAETVRAFWREEDELVGEVLRAEERRTFEEAERPVRTALLAMFASYSDEPWDEDSLSW